MIPIFFSLIAFLAIIILFAAIYMAIQRKEKLEYQSQRFEQVINIKPQGYSEHNKDEHTTAKDPESISLRRDQRLSSIPWLNEILTKVLKNNTKSVAGLIEQSGIKVKAGEFILFTCLVGLIGALVVDLFFHIPIVGFVACILPFLLLNFIKHKRVDDFINQLPQALDLLSSDIRAGVDVQTGLKHLSEEFAAPLSEEFGKVVVEVNLGLSISDALNNLSKRINTADVQILCTGIIINRELGGNLSELLVGVGETIRERFRLKGMIKSLTAENEMSTYLLMALPVGLFIMLSILAPETYAPFMSDPIGQKILVSCGISMAIGYIVIKKMTTLEV